MSRRLTIAALTTMAVVSILLILIYAFNPKKPTLGNLQSQLEHQHCTFRFQASPPLCYSRGIFNPIDPVFLEWGDCELWAVHCIAQLPADESIPVLIAALASTTDKTTCDGDIPVRTQIVRYLGLMGDKRALAPLEKHLLSIPQSTLTDGMTACSPGPEPIDEIVKAIETLRSETNNN